jgi:hypothetical protein
MRNLVAGGVVPTLNAFDMGDTRASCIVMREREGKAGGGRDSTSREQEFHIGAQVIFRLFSTDRE